MIQRLFFLSCIFLMTACRKQDPAPVLDPPQAAFTYASTGSLPVTVQFTNTSVSVGPATYSWDFGDGSVTSALTNPTHSYSGFGVYNAKLIQIDPAGANDSVIYSINTAISGNGGGSATSPGANFLFNVNATPPITVTFNNNSLYADGYLWDFGDGAGSTADSAVVHHVYTAAGLYQVRLVAFGNNMADTATVSLSL